MSNRLPKGLLKPGLFSQNMMHLNNKKYSPKKKTSRSNSRDKDKKSPLNRIYVYPDAVFNKDRRVERDEVYQDNKENIENSMIAKALKKTRSPGLKERIDQRSQGTEKSEEQNEGNMMTALSKLVHENSSLKEKLKHVLQDNMKQKNYIESLELHINSMKNSNLDERKRYEEELAKFTDRIGKLKGFQDIYNKERSQNESLEEELNAKTLEIKKIQESLDSIMEKIMDIKIPLCSLFNSPSYENAKTLSVWICEALRTFGKKMKNTDMSKRIFKEIKEIESFEYRIESFIEDFVSSSSKKLNVPDIRVKDHIQVIEKLESSINRTGITHNLSTSEDYSQNNFNEINISSRIQRENIPSKRRSVSSSNFPLKTPKENDSVEIMDGILDRKDRIDRKPLGEIKNMKPSISQNKIATKSNYNFIKPNKSVQGNISQFYSKKNLNCENVQGIFISKDSSYKKQPEFQDNKQLFSFKQENAFTIMSEKLNSESMDLGEESCIRESVHDPSPFFVQAISSFKSNKENEISFSKGDQIKILKKLPGSSWIGMLDKNIGYLDPSLVKPI